MQKKMNDKMFRLFFNIGVVLLFLGSVWYFVKKDQPKASLPEKTTVSKVMKQKKEKTKTSSDLPKVNLSDWELILVNRDHIVKELNPELATVEGVYVDSRIANQVSEFLAAAREISPMEHLISGYRSVAYQEQVYEGYVQQEMLTGLTREEAERQVQTYSQPAGASEHQTGLAIDMSTVDSLNQSDPLVVEQVVALAKDYGFVQRFSDDTTDETGIGYEDWHFRYVGKESAEYMTKHNLSLEAYIKLLEDNNR